MMDYFDDIIRKNRLFLVDNISASEKLLSYLQKHKMLTKEMCEEISNCRISSAKSGKLLDLLWRQSDYAFIHLIMGLYETNQIGAAERLISKLDAIRRYKLQYDLHKYLNIYTLIRVYDSISRVFDDIDLSDITTQNSVVDRQASNTCVVCFDRERDVVYHTCKHYVSCEVCMTFLNKCPICRTPIEKWYKIYKS